MELLFLSFTTLSSTGLSDIMPISGHARSVVMLEQVAGVFYIAMVVTRLVACDASARAGRPQPGAASDREPLSTALELARARGRCDGPAPGSSASSTALGRDDLADAAQLGVSELVTNAILHADPPIAVRLGGTRSHPRVEVHDSSARAAVGERRHDRRRPADAPPSAAAWASWRCTPRPWGAEVVRRRQGGLVRARASEPGADGARPGDALRPRRRRRGAARRRR